MSAAELALWARVDGLSPETVQSALWQERTLVKTWAMRGTLHLLAADELPLYVAARSVYDTYKWDKYFAYYGFTPAQQQAFIAAVPEVLSGDPMTREQFATAVAGHIGAPQLAKILLSSSWGSLFKPSAFRGDLCFGPNQGRNVTFVNPRKWLGEWQSIEPYSALQEIARRYLTAYGPSTPEDFVRWWWGSAALSVARKLFRSLMDDLEEVDVEGWRAYALRETLAHMQAPDTSGTVNLLPLFDAYILGSGRDIEALLPAAFKSLVFRPQGWISAVVLVDGFMKGVWEHKTQGVRTTVKVQMFSPATRSLRNSIEAEADRLSAFLNTRIALTYEDPPEK
jgi:hypothetical protein